MYKYPHIDQFRNIVNRVNFYDETYTSPIKGTTIRFHGTVKIHGANSAVIIQDGKLISAQSRSRVIVPGDDNYGFAAWAYSKDWRHIFSENGYIDFTGRKIAVYGEWCGGSIQKGVGVTKLEKMFVIFEVTDVTDYAQDENGHVTGIFDIPLYALNDLPDDCYLSTIFPTWEIDIDFSDPEASRDLLQKLTDQVERECPVAKHFGVSGTGEGIVWKAETETGTLRFKVKGEEHTAYRAPKISETQDYDQIEAFVQDALKHRLQQAWDYVAEIGKPHLMSSTGDFMRWIATDINREEADTIANNGFDKKAVNQTIDKHAKKWWLERIK